jgi:O-antigen ligase/tetratricopeptide (TPR) repeat protein
MFFPFITGKAIFFRVLVEIAFASWVILAFLDAKYRPRINAMTIAVTVFTVVVLIADLLGVNPMRSIMSNFERMEGWITILHLWMFFMAIVHTFGTGEEGRKMWFRFVNTSILVAVYIGWEAFMQWMGWSSASQGGARTEASLGNAAYLAVYMLMHAGLSAYLFIENLIKRKNLLAHHHKTVFIVREWIYIILTVFFGVIVFSTATRGAILGMVGGILLALFLYAVVGNKKEHRKIEHSAVRANMWRMISAGIIILVIALGYITWLYRDSDFVKGNLTLQRMTSISSAQYTKEGRAYVWPMAIKGFMERPILGWGQENFNYIFNSKYDPKMWGHEQWFDRAHSVYLDWMISGGALGLLAYLSLFIVLLVYIWRSDLRTSEKSIFTGLVSAYMVHNIFVFDHLASYVTFFVLLSLSVLFRNKEDKPLFGNKDASQDAVNYVVLPIVVILFIASMYFWNYRTYKANTLLIQGLSACQTANPDKAVFDQIFVYNSYTANQETREQMLQCAIRVIGNQQISNNVKQEFFSLANKAIEDQIKDTPKDARIYVLAGSFLNMVGQFDRAKEMLDKAMVLSPNKQTINMELAQNYLNNNKIPDAVKLMEETYNLATDNTQVKTLYVASLVLNNEESRAREMFKDDPSIFNSDLMARVYMSKKEYAKALKIYEAVVANDPKNLDAIAQLAQAQHTAGMTEKAIATIRTISRDYPEYTTQVEQIVKEMQSK